MNRTRRTNRATRANDKTRLLIFCVSISLILGQWLTTRAYAKAPLAPIPGKPPVLQGGGIDLSQFRLTFSDEFTGNTLDTTKWENCDEPRQGASYWRKPMVRVNGGYLHLGAKLTNDPVYRYDCGAVRTQIFYDPNKTLFQQKYGYFEASCRLPKDLKADYWAAFWLMCGNVGDNTPDTQKGLEVDIMESFNYLSSDKHKVSFHWNGYGTLHNVAGIQSAISSPQVNDGKFHKFGLYWDEKYYILYVDNIEVARTTFMGYGSSTGGKMLSNGPCRQPGHVLLSLEAAPWAGATSSWESRMSTEDEFVVDYVRVYQGTLNL